MAGAALRSGAQQTSACTEYRDCALAVAARWNGLAVTRGDQQQRVVTLNFFVPNNVRSAFTSGGDSSLVWASHAARRRRIASTFTDIGLILGVVAAVANTQRKNDATTGTVGVVGAALFVMSVPLQFSADNALSRAVWWHNLRLSGH